MTYEHEAEEWRGSRSLNDLTQHECAEDELHEALKRLVALVKDIQYNSEGHWPTLEPSCNECTHGSTPYRYDKGRCAYHAAKRLLKQLEVRP